MYICVCVPVGTEKFDRSAANRSGILKVEDEALPDLYVLTCDSY